MIGEERINSPGTSKYRDDEEDQNGIWRQRIGTVVLMHKVGKHAQGWDQSNDLEEAPKGEEDAKQHRVRFVRVGRCLQVVTRNCPHSSIDERDDIQKTVEPKS